jgi:hypothetical protein
MMAGKSGARNGGNNELRPAPLKTRKKNRSARDFARDGSVRRKIPGSRPRR